LGQPLSRATRVGRAAAANTVRYRTVRIGQADDSRVRGQLPRIEVPSLVQARHDATPRSSGSSVREPDERGHHFAGSAA
jgi:hypothetical protein